MKNIPMVILAFFFFTSSSCIKNERKKASHDKYKDSSLFKYACQIFGPSALSYSGFMDANVLKKRFSKEIIIHPGQYRFKKYEWGDGQSYNPFVIEVKDSNNNLISYFSFSDEVYYMGMFDSLKVNNHKSSYSLSKNEYWKPITRDTNLINLNTELNKLIQNLGYQNDKYLIQNLIETIFSDLLQMRNMRRFPTTEVFDFKNLLIRVNKKSVLDSSIKELTEVMSANSYNIFECKEGIHGYWQFNIEKEKNDKDSFVVKAKLLGSQFYYGLYF